jgi:hypothetical protein
MIKASPAEQVAMVTSALQAGVFTPENAKRVLNAYMKELYPDDAITEVARKPSERVCQTCSKTCDVGIACWWCGNA